MTVSQTAVDLTPFFTAAGLPAPQREVSYGIPGRKFRADYAWPTYLVAFEREGDPAGKARGGSGKSRHTTLTGYSEDIVKYNAAQLIGWLVIRAAPAHIQKGRYLLWIEAALYRRGWRSPTGHYYSLCE